MSFEQSPSWQKSTYSPDGNNCVELAAISDGVLHLRESDDASTVLTTTPDRLRGFLALARRAQEGADRER